MELIHSTYADFYKEFGHKIHSKNFQLKPTDIQFLLNGKANGYCSGIEKSSVDIQIENGKVELLIIEDKIAIKILDTELLDECMSLAEALKKNGYKYHMDTSTYLMISSPFITLNKHAPTIYKDGVFILYGFLGIKDSLFAKVKP